MEKHGISAAAPEMNYAQQQPPMYHDPNVAGAQGQIYQQPPMQQYPQSPAPGQPMYYPPQQQMNPQQQQMNPQMQMGQVPPGQPGINQAATQFKNATPVASLGRGPAPVDCPACGQRGMTNISYEIGNSTHAWALGLCCLVCLGCIPYLMNSLKDVQHKCGKCGVLLATWHRSGSTEVHLHG